MMRSTNSINLLFVSWSINNRKRRLSLITHGANMVTRRAHKSENSGTNCTSENGRSVSTIRYKAQKEKLMKFLIFNDRIQEISRLCFLSLCLTGLTFEMVPAYADAAKINDFTETFAQRCLFDEPSAYSSFEATIDLPFFQRSVSQDVPEIIFADIGNWSITKFVSSETYIVECLFTTELPLEDVSAAISNIAGTVDDVPPFMDKPDGRNIVLLMEGDGNREPDFLAIVSLLSASEGDLSRTYGTVSFLPFALFQ